MEQVLQLNVNLFFTIINLVVLYLLLKKFLIKPVTKVIEALRKDDCGRLESGQQCQGRGKGA